MENRIEEIKRDITAEIQTVSNSKELYELKSKYVLNKVGIIPALMKELGKAPKEDRPRLGQVINALKDWASEVFAQKESEIVEIERKARYEAEAVDITMPAKKVEVGTLHPVTLIKNELVDIFAGMGFEVVETR